MDGSMALLTAAKVVTLSFGGILTLLSVRAYRRTGSPALRALAIGIGLVTTGAILGGALHQILGLTLETSATLQSVFTAIGFGVLTYSLYTKSPAPQRDRGSGHQPGGD
jgi:threonine/homoserine/homoserine lactone efflux protein